jgi:hypothetical protein
MSEHYSVISPLMLFPPISWWSIVITGTPLYFDLDIGLRQNVYQHRYKIAGSNGALSLSVPIEGGSHQTISIGRALISNSDNWQRRHWRTLVSCYNRSAYFQHYAPALEALFFTPWTSLSAFAHQSIQFIAKSLQCKLNEVNHPAEGTLTLDLRKIYPEREQPSADYPNYSQVFEDRLGFIPELSILDLLCCEGPYAAIWLKEQHTIFLSQVYSQHKQS